MTLTKRQKEILEHIQGFISTCNNKNRFLPDKGLSP